MKHTIVFHLIGVSKELQKAFGFKSQSLPLSYSQAMSLLVIDTEPQINQAKIAIKLHLEPASVVTLIDELEKLNLVSRTSVKNNRRQYQIKLTKKGNVHVQKIRSQAENLEKFIKRQLKTADSNSLKNSLEKLTESLNSLKNSQNIKKGGE